MSSVKPPVEVARVIGKAPWTVPTVRMVRARDLGTVGLNLSKHANDELDQLPTATRLLEFE